MPVGPEIGNKSRPYNQYLHLFVQWKVFLMLFKSISEYFEGVFGLDITPKNTAKVM